MTTTSQGLPIPTVDVSAARSAALRIRQAAGAAEQCLDHLADSAPADWIGQASQAYLEGRAVVSRRATDLAEACAVLDRAVVEFSEEVAAVLPRWRPAAERLDQLELTCSDPARAGLPDATPGQLEVLIRERDALRVEVAAWQRRYDEATLLLSGACSRVMTIIDDGRLSTADQLWAIPETVVQQMVLEPLALVALLADDPSQVDDVAKAAWFGVVDQVWHPSRTALEMAGVPAFQEGRWGEGAATGSVSIVGLIGLRRIIRDVQAGRPPTPGAGRRWPPPPGTKGIGKNGWLTEEQLVQFQRNMDIRDADAPIRTQTLDELRAGTDLSRSEHPRMGHTLSRHVDAPQDYLELRLNHGTPENDGSLGRRLSVVSSWTDRSTAEQAVTDSLSSRENQGLVASMAQGHDGSWTLTAIGPDLGTVYRLDDQLDLTATPATYAKITFVREDGELFVMTTRLHDDVPEAGRG